MQNNTKMEKVGQNDILHNDYLIFIYLNYT